MRTNWIITDSNYRVTPIKDLHPGDLVDEAFRKADALTIKEGEKSKIKTEACKSALKQLSNKDRQNVQYAAEIIEEKVRKGFSTGSALELLMHLGIFLSMVEDRK